MTSTTTLEVQGSSAGRTRGAAAGPRHLAPVASTQVTGPKLTRVRDHNQLLVLHMVRTRGPLTRRDLSRATGLTFQTIENISRRLVGAGIVEDVAPRTGTHRARRLALRPAGAHAVGIEVTPDAYGVALCDLSGRVVSERRRPRRGPESILDELVPAALDLIDDAEVLITTVVATGLAVSGSDRRPFGQEGVCAELERRLQMPVLCPSGVVAAARAEQWTTRMSTQDFIYLHLAAELGCAVVMHGRLCRGARGRGGDIAHTPAVNDGELCTCGRRGCLHTLLTEHGLRRAIAAALGGPEPSALDHIARLASSDRRVAAVVECLAGHVGDALLTAVQLLDPELIIVGGPVADALGATFRDAVERQVALARFEAPGPAVQRARRDAGGAASAAQYVLYEIFAPAPP